MTAINLGSPTQKQLQFINSKKRRVGYGGARGGGKSWAVRAKAVLLAGKYPGIKILIVRRTYPELINNHINPMRELLGKSVPYNKQEKIFNFPNGSTIKFGYCNADKDVLQYQGAEYDVIFLDEATQLQEDWIVKITACNRGVNDFVKQIVMTCNPGGVSHAYIKRLFVDRQYKGAENPDDYEFIQALVTDNKALMESDPEYVNQLKNLPEKLKKAWLYGDWDIFEGMYFEEFRNDPEHYRDRRWTHVIDPFTPRSYWPIYRSFDWGYSKPFSMGYYTIDPDGVIYRIAEFYGCQKSGGESIANEGMKWSTHRVFAEIQRFEHEHPYLSGKEITGVADPAIWDADGGISIADTAMKYGIFFQPGDHKRVPGWQQCHYRLQFDEGGYPKFYVFNTCKDFIRTIPTLQYDDHHVEDLDSDGEDHIADEWRYFCQSRPLEPTIPKEEYQPMWGANPLDQKIGGRR